MKKLFFMAVAAIAALSSCSNDNEFEQKQTGNQGLVFTATMENSVAVRATYNSENKCAAWEASDQISINGKTYLAETPGTITTFKADGEDATGPTYNTYFPASLYNNGTPTLPANVSETWADGKFNMPMYATSNTTSLAFKNLCGVLKITVKSDEIAAVKKIKVSSANKAISGAFIITSDAAELTSPSTIANALTVTYTDAVTTTAEGKVFYVAVPAQTYQELKIELDADGSGFTKSMTTKSATDITVARNTIYPITFADNAAPPATTGTAKRKGNKDVNWVQLWENGPKFAEYNVGASSATDVGTPMDFSNAIKTGDNYVWGANWCTPSKDDLEHLMTAAKYQKDDKVACSYVQESGVWGFKFTGKETGYTDNTVFFPAQNGGSGDGEAEYWSATPYPSSSNAYYLDLEYDDGDWSYSNLSTHAQEDYDCLVRPVLKN